MITPETVAGMMRAADACEKAGIKHAAKMLRMVAADTKADDEDAERYLNRASFAADCLFYYLLDADLDKARLATDAANICGEEDASSTFRRLGISQKPGPAKCERCGDEPCVECKTRAA